MKLNKLKTTLFWELLRMKVPRVIPTYLFKELNFENPIVHVEIDFTFERITFFMFLTSDSYL